MGSQALHERRPRLGHDRAWLPISAAARALGVSTSTLRAWAANGQVPHVRGWVLVVAQALRTGRMADALERAGAHGRAHGLAGSSARATMAGALAVNARWTRCWQAVRFHARSATTWMPCCGA